MMTSSNTAAIISLISASCCLGARRHPRNYLVFVFILVFIFVHFVAVFEVFKIILIRIIIRLIFVLYFQYGFDVVHFRFQLLDFFLQLFYDVFVVFHCTLLIGWHE